MHTLIIGSPGAGKSTFARRLAELTGLPLVHLDMIYHRPDRTTISREEFDARLMDVLSGVDCIIDGNYRRTIHLRLEYAERVFLFDLPTEVCIEGIKSRVGTHRTDLPWVEEALDPEFEQAVLSFREKNIDYIYGLLEGNHRAEVIIFHSREEAESYLNKLKRGGKL